jgi:hypothetical protein
MDALLMLTHVLAQAMPPWAVPDPAPLPESSWFDRLILESPGALVLGLVLVVIAGVVAGRRAAWGNRVLVVAGVVALLGVGVAVLSMLVQTDREEIAARTQRMVAAVVGGDRQDMETLLGAHVQVTYFGAPQGLNKQETITRVTTLHSTGILAGVKAGAASVQTVADNQRFGRSQVKVSATGDITGGYPTLSWWKLDWEKVDDQWQVVGVEPISIPGMRNPTGR